MSEVKVDLQKPKRTLQDVQREYNSLCAKAGHVQYQLFVSNRDLALINSQLSDLNLEAVKIQAEAQEQEIKEAQADIDAVSGPEVVQEQA